MTKPALPTRSVLLRSCAPAALTVAAMAAPQTVSAQAFQATPTIVQGDVSIIREIPGQEEITITGLDAIVDWAPIENSGGVETFLPAGNVATFQGGPGETTFAVLNRILPTAVSTPTDFAGTVRAILLDGNFGEVGPGGFVAFYSPTGIIVSGTAVFQVPQLVLSTNDIDATSFTDFASGSGPLLLSGSNSFINIQAGASLTGSPEGSFFIVSSSQIDMAGDAYFNGSTAYVGAVEAQLTHNSGLFDIVIPFGGGVEGFAINHTGSTGGPDSSGPGDNHVIYGITRAASGSQLGVSSLFSGNLGFDPAGVATVSDGEIILSAGYDVAGREIDGGQTGQGASSFFNGRGNIPFETADIFLGSLSTTSNLTAISTHQTLVDGVESSSDFAGDLVVVGREQAIIDTAFGGSITVGGELYLSANNFGVGGNSFPDAVTGGLALVSAGPDGQVSVGGASTITASAFAESDFTGTSLGASTGGQARVLAEGGSITFGGQTLVQANGDLDGTGPFDFAGAFTGGEVEFLAFEGGDISVGGGLDLEAFANSPSLLGPNADLPGDTTGGSITVGTGVNGGFVLIDGQLSADASAIAGDGVSTDSPGASATGGTVLVTVTPNSDFAVGGDTFLFADAYGGSVTGGGDGGAAFAGDLSILAAGQTLFDGQLYMENAAGGGDGFAGGAATGGSTSLLANGAALTINGLFEILGSAVGGAGLGSGPGGDATGGNVLVEALGGGQFLIPGSDALIDVSALGGSADTGPGGDALGGDVTVDADNATVDFGGNVDANFGATGGDAPTGGNGTAGNGVLSIAGSDANFGGDLVFDGTGRGGSAGSGGASLVGGSGFGGTIQFTIDNSTFTAASTGRTVLSAEGQGAGSADGTGGDGVGGTTQFDIIASRADFGEIDFFTLAVSGGSDTQDGGTAQAGDNIFAITDSTVTSADIVMENTATGNASPPGGDALGGLQSIALDNASLTSARLFLYGGAISRSNGAVATASDNLVTLADGSSASFTETYAEAYTASGNGATTTNTSGNITFAILDAGLPSTLSLGVTELYIEAVNGAENIAGSFNFLAPTGSITMQSLEVFAGGDEGAATVSSLSATGGDIVIPDFADVFMTGDLQLEYANGGTIVGGASLADLTASFDFSTLGTIFIDGDDASAPFIGSDFLALSSLDIEVGPLSRVGAQSVEITSLDEVHTNILGGTTAGAGWTLTAAEAAAFDPTSLTFRLPATPNAIDAEVRDIQFLGSQSGNLEQVSVISGGTLAVVGQLDFDGMGLNDTLSLSASETLQVLLPGGGISMSDSDGLPAGSLFLSANGILMTTSDIAAIILADPLDPAIPDALDDITATGVTGPSTYISAGSVSLSATGYVYGQNTGDAEDFAGIEVNVGGAGLSISQIDPAPGDPPLNVVVYGRAFDGPNNSSQTNNDFFFATESAGGLEGPFSDASTLNNCFINTVDCGSPTPTPGGPGPNPGPEIPTLERAILPPNVTLLEEPLEEDEVDDEEEDAEVSEPASDDEFGVDFPALFNAPIVEDDERVTDPVTSGGDSALYSLGTPETVDDEDGGAN